MRKSLTAQTTALADRRLDARMLAEEDAISSSSDGDRLDVGTTRVPRLVRDSEVGRDQLLLDFRIGTFLSRYDEPIDLGKVRLLVGTLRSTNVHNCLLLGAKGWFDAALEAIRETNSQPHSELTVGRVASFRIR